MLEAHFDSLIDEQRGVELDLAEAAVLFQQACDRGENWPASSGVIPDR